jgi:ferric-dicitrate binding protein FerR (iron transport regulator)
MEDKTTYYEGLMAAYFSGEATPREIMQLSAWLTEDQANLDSFESYRKAWLLTGKDALSSSVNIDAEWKAISSKLTPGVAEVVVPAVKAGKGRLFSLLISWKAAAALLVLLVSATAVFYLNFDPDMVIAKAETGNLEQILPDGTIVSLLKGSEIEYPSQFKDNKREVRLEGEAYFSVKRDSTKPFIVSDGNARIEVLGTSFNVNTKADAGEVIVVLTSGKVSLYFEGRESENIILHPGEKAEMNVMQKVITTGLNADPNYMAWKTGRIIFENSSLDQVISALNKVYHQEFRLGNPQLSGCSLTATFDQQPLGSVIKVIEATLDVEIISVEGAMVINGPGCIE